MVSKKRRKRQIHNKIQTQPTSKIITTATKKENFQNHGLSLQAATRQANNKKPKESTTDRSQQPTKTCSL